MQHHIDPPQKPLCTPWTITFVISSYLVMDIFIMNGILTNVNSKHYILQAYYESWKFSNKVSLNLMSNIKIRRHSTYAIIHDPQ